MVMILCLQEWFYTALVALHRITSYIINAIGEGNYSFAIFFDLTSTFDDILVLHLIWSYDTYVEITDKNEKYKSGSLQPIKSTPPRWNINSSISLVGTHTEILQRSLWDGRVPQSWKK